MMIKLIPEVTAEAERFRLERRGPFLTPRRDPIEPVPVGSFVVMVFRVTGYDPDCDGSLMARVAHVDREGEPTGWEARALGLYPDSTVQIDAPAELWGLATEEPAK